MKIKTKFIPDMLIDYLFSAIVLFFVFVCIFFNIYYWYFYFLVILLFYSIINILFSHCISPLVIDIDHVKMRKLFIRKSIVINNRTNFYIKSFLGLKCFRTRLIIMTDTKKMILWDQFNVTLEEIVEEIVQRNPESINLIIK